jgi:DNA-binding SARP family transcriptional activator
VLRILLFGSVEISWGDSPHEIQLTRSVQALLAFLALERHRTHPRDVLAGLFWGEHDQAHARNALNTALWRLRQALEPQGIPRGTYLTSSPGGALGLNPGATFWLDVAEFEKHINAVLRHPAAALEPTDLSPLVGAWQLYRADLLEAFYEDWALRERERLRLLYLKSLTYALCCYKVHGLLDDALACGERILGLDPLREEVQREMIRLYLQKGERALAARQYETCRAILEAELNIPPMEETRALYSLIHTRSLSTPDLASITRSANLAETLTQLRGLALSLQQIQSDLQQTLDQLDRLVHP